jgi:hypothetical protein
MRIFIRIAFTFGCCALLYAQYLLYLIPPAPRPGARFTQPWPQEESVRHVARVITTFGSAGIVLGLAGLIYQNLSSTRSSSSEASEIHPPENSGKRNSNAR